MNILNKQLKTADKGHVTIQSQKPRNQTDPTNGQGI